MLAATLLMTLGCFVSQAALTAGFVLGLLALAWRVRRSGVAALVALPGLGAPIALSVAAFAISTVAGHAPSVSAPYVTELKRPLLAYVVAASIAEPRDARVVLLGTALGAAATTAVAFRQYVHGGTWVVHHVATTWAPYELVRPHGLASTCNDLGTLLAQATSLFAVPALFCPLAPAHRAAAAAAAAIAGLGMLRSLSRAALAGVLAALALAGLLRHPRRLTALLVALCCLYPLLPPRLTFRHRELLAADSYSILFRLRMLPVSVAIARRYFPWGAGRHNFPNVHASMIVPGEEVSPHAHNNYLNVLAENGWLGLLALAWLQAASLAFVRRSAERPGAGALEAATAWGLYGALVAFAVSGMFLFTWGDAMPVSLWWVLVGTAYGAGRARPPALAQ